MDRSVGHVGGEWLFPSHPPPRPLSLGLGPRIFPTFAARDPQRGAAVSVSTEPK